jgi:hypothetical protein
MHPRERETDLSNKAVPAASLGQTRERLSERERARARRGGERGCGGGRETERERERDLSDEAVPVWGKLLIHGFLDSFGLAQKTPSDQRHRLQKTLCQFNTVDVHLILS